MVDLLTIAQGGQFLWSHNFINIVLQGYIPW